MSDQIEAAGALVTAGLAANALDQPAGGTASHGACANCGAALAGPFCGQCGQRAHLHRTLGAVFHEFLHGITHFDGKAWQTLPMLLFRPGRLTRSYIEGHRARYIAPVPLFLLVVFLMFFVLSFASIPDDAVKVGGNTTSAERAAEAKKALADIDRELAAARATGDQSKIKELETARAGVAIVTKRAGDPNASADDLLSDIGRGVVAASQKDDLTIVEGFPELDRKAKEALKNPSLVLYKLQTKAYKLSFLLVPLSLPWLWLAFFWKPKVNGVRIGMYDHAIFALYSISFMSLLFITGSLGLTAGVTSGLFWLPLLLAPAVHMFAQLRGAYALGWFGAAWRTIYLSFAAVISLSLYLMILIIVGVLD
ncbi:DUF3667 domain-containing protein [Sandarakinorhabdus oryzae]|uniref:DUF3667 domain-containing protein n=1 Tax=Sandarakinorhabdus oryzae TaxID=2675220 RepID=UPI0012E10EC9|nr:DUF3667 domain-containing protein [Sandarakinorhabdus oryzae]